LIATYDLIRLHSYAYFAPMLLLDDMMVLAMNVSAPLVSFDAYKWL